MMSDISLAEMGINFREQKEQTKRLQMLRQRAARCVCRYCGNPLSLRKITYAAYDEAKIEIFCERCGRIEFGTEPEIYQVAQYFIDEIQYDHYPNLDESVRKRRMNIAMICDILNWGFKNTGLLQAEGFTCSIALDEDTLTEAFAISESDLAQLDKE